MLLESKSEVRKRIKTLISNFTSEIKIKKSREVSKNLLHFLDKFLPEKFPNYSSDGIIGGYAPLSDEVDWLIEAQKIYGRLAFPGTHPNGKMAFFKSKPEELVESSVFGVTVKGPVNDLKVVTPELLLIPGLAFTLKGERLGRGKGYYDKYLESFKGLKIGICTNEQIIEEIPVEAHDIKMDGLISDSGIQLF